jgi:hypothetical protein
MSMQTHSVVTGERVEPSRGCPRRFLSGKSQPEVRYTPHSSVTAARWPGWSGTPGWRNGLSSKRRRRRVASPSLADRRDHAKSAATSPARSRGHGTACHGLWECEWEWSQDALLGLPRHGQLRSAEHHHHHAPAMGCPKSQQSGRLGISAPCHCVLFASVGGDRHHRWDARQPAATRRSATRNLGDAVAERRGIRTPGLAQPEPYGGLSSVARWANADKHQSGSVACRERESNPHEVALGGF